jgi:hypothetical protein
MSQPTFTCAQCGGDFTSERSDEEAHAEAERNVGKDGRAPGMVVVCDDCYGDVMARHRDESITDRMAVELLHADERTGFNLDYGS